MDMEYSRRDVARDAGSIFSIFPVEHHNDSNFMSWTDDKCE